MNIETTPEFKKLLVASTAKAEVKQVLEKIDTLDPETIKLLLLAHLQMVEVKEDFTPPAKWLIEDKSDPHGSYYSSNERSKLAMGDWTDDSLANAMFLVGDSTSERLGSLSSMFSGIAVLTASKERIRWLSRRVTWLENELRPLLPRAYVVKPGDTLYGITERKTGNGDRWHELHDNNPHIVDPNLINPGDTLLYPESWLKTIP